MPTGAFGRVLAVALLVILSASLYLLMIGPLWDVYARRQDQLETDRMMLARLNAAEAELPGLQARLEMLRGAVNNRIAMLYSASDSIASATLQNRIEQQATGAGATIRSTEGLAVEPRGSYRRIGIRVALSGSYQNIIEFLAGMDGATPPLVVGDLQIRGIPQFGTTPNGRFEAQFDVYAFRSADATAEAKP